MNNPHRVLVYSPAGWRGVTALRHARELAAGRAVEIKVLRVVDIRSGFESDGPLGVLAEHRAARRVAAAKKQIDRELTQSGLASATSIVTSGEGAAALATLIREWRPDTVVCDATMSRKLFRRSNRVAVQTISLVPATFFSRFTRFFAPQPAARA